MATLWLSYAWDDNRAGDVDFLVQELVSAGVAVKLDRWNISAGRRLWEQIERFIQDPRESDAWAMYATQASLGSEPCREEFAYALDRALKSRGDQFPVIGIFPGPVDDALIPAGIRTRLYVSLTDPDWKDRIVAASESRAANVARPHLDPFALQVHRDEVRVGGKSFAIEVRPRAGTWSPFFAAIPASESERVNPHIMHGPRGRVPNGGVLMNTGTGLTDDKKWWIAFAQNEATPTQSYFVHCDTLPSQLAFGVNGGTPQFTVTIKA